MSKDQNAAIDAILDFLDTSANNVTPMDLEREVGSATGLDRKVIRNTVKSLIQEAVLEYRDKNGRTGISRSFSCPVRLSDRVIVSPPDLHVDRKPEDVVIRLNSGTAFGRGDHPTTQLCVNALDFFLKDGYSINNEIRTALDIGTGSGILALAAARMGVEKIWACDRDSVAESEARGNILLNDLHERIVMVRDIDTTISYDLIIANLRYPTLIDLYPFIRKITHGSSALVLSGMKESEIKTVDDIYTGDGFFSRLWTRSRRGWSGLVYTKV